MLFWYLFRSEIHFKKVVLIIDAKIGLNEFDKEMLSSLNEKEFPVVIAVNKTDKLKRNVLDKQLKIIQKEVGDNVIVSYSAKTKKGRDELLDEIFKKN